MAPSGAKRARKVGLEKYVSNFLYSPVWSLPTRPTRGHVMQERPNVFIDATSADLGSYRRAVRDARWGVAPIVQNLERDYQKLM